MWLQDELLLAAFEEHGTRWTELAREVGGGRSFQSCRTRWLSVEFQSKLSARGVELSEEEKVVLSRGRAAIERSKAKQQANQPPAQGPWTIEEVRRSLATSLAAHLF